MPQRDIIVIGGSAGSFDPLRIIISSLPASFPGSVLIVTHMMADFPSLLEEHLSSNSRVPVSQAADQEPIRRGHIYVARPDYHLTVEAGKMRVLRGPRENRHRPAIDPLFRTAARVYGQRVIGIILSGTLEDGSMGPVAVKQRGGVAVVQDPEDALCGDMPRNALQSVEVDYCLPAVDIAKLISRLSRESVELHSPTPSLLEQETDIALERISHSQHPPGNPSEFACPSCGGVLNELHEGKVLRFRCRVGHAYGPAALTADQQDKDKIEAALWAALRALEDQIALHRRLASRAREQGYKHSASRFGEHEEGAREQAEAIRTFLKKRERWIPEDVPARDPA